MAPHIVIIIDFIPYAIHQNFFDPAIQFLEIILSWQNKDVI